MNFRVKSLKNTFSWYYQWKLNVQCPCSKSSVLSSCNIFALAALTTLAALAALAAIAALAPVAAVAAVAVLAALFCLV